MRGIDIMRMHLMKPVCWNFKDCFKMPHKTRASFKPLSLTLNLFPYTECADERERILHTAEAEFIVLE